MDENSSLAKRFGAHRIHLRAVALRMLGSPTEADDAVQEAWLRLSGSDAREVENLGGWLTTVVSRVCLDMLRARRSRAEEPLDAEALQPSASEERAIDPEREALLADAVGPALQVVLDALPPAERVAFVLHDMFAVSFEEIAAILGRSPVAARQLASRARRRVQGATVPDTRRARERTVVEAFLVAARQGNFEALLAVLDPEVVVRADGAAVRMGATEEVRGAPAVANSFKGRAAAAQLALVNGAPAVAWVHGGKPRVVFRFRIVGEKIVEIDLVGDAAARDQLDLVILTGGEASAGSG
jgi:RNA polymerase sigma-70 factor (ECF subfamily)